MLKRHEAMGGGTDSSATLLINAALLAVLAGTPLGLAQDSTAGEYDPVSAGEASFFDDQPTDSPDGPVSLNADDVEVDDNELITLHFRDEDLTTALQMLSIQAQRSIVPTQNVSGTVTANLYGQTFENALDAILLYNGYGYIEEGNTIYVMPIEEIRQIEQESRVREHMVVRLNYLSATDAAQFCQPLLSEGGSITTNGVAGDYVSTDSGPVGAENWALGSTMLIVDYPDRIESVMALIDELDTKPSSVLVEATILQSAISEANAFGVDFSIINSVDFADFSLLGGPLRVADALISGGGSSGSTGDTGDTGDTGSVTAIPDDGRGTGITSSVGNTAAPGGFKVGVVHDDVAVFLRLLDEVGDTTIVSNPKVLTLNRQSASVQVGRRVGYLSTTTTQTTSSQTVEFLDTGTQLYFRPFVTNDNRIRMELQPKVSQPIIRTVTDATGAGVTVPDEDTSQLTTNVLLNDGETAVLGGLFTERTIATRRQVPFFGDLPLIGPGFRGHDDSMSRSEIIFLITPSIVSDEDMSQAGAHANEYVEYARAGARAGLLPWSRDKRATQLLVEAQRLSMEGETTLALNKIRRSLTLSPVQPDAIEMRQMLMNDPGMWPSRSTLEHVLHDEAAQWQAAIKQAQTQRAQATVQPLPSTATAGEHSPDFDELYEQAVAREGDRFDSIDFSSWPEPTTEQATAGAPTTPDELDSNDEAAPSDNEDFAVVDEEPQANSSSSDPIFEQLDDAQSTVPLDSSSETASATESTSAIESTAATESIAETESASASEPVDLFEVSTDPGTMPWQLGSAHDSTAVDFSTALEILSAPSDSSPLALDGASESQRQLELEQLASQFGFKTALFGPWSLLTSFGDTYTAGNAHAEVLEGESFDEN